MVFDIFRYIFQTSIYHVPGKQMNSDSSGIKLSKIALVFFYLCLLKMVTHIFMDRNLVPWNMIDVNESYLKWSFKKYRIPLKSWAQTKLAFTVNKSHVITRPGVAPLLLATMHVNHARWWNSSLITYTYENLSNFKESQWRTNVPHSQIRKYKSSDNKIMYIWLTKIKDSIV